MTTILEKHFRTICIVLGLALVCLAAWRSNQPIKPITKEQQEVEQMMKCTALLLENPDEAGKCSVEFLHSKGIRLEDVK